MCTKMVLSWQKLNKLFFADQHTNRSSLESIFLAELVFEKTEIGGRDVVRMADKQRKDRGLCRDLSHEGRLGDLRRFAFPPRQGVGGGGWVARISWRNLFNAPVGIRFEKAVNTRSIVGKSWPSESGWAAEAKRTGAQVRKGKRRRSSSSTSLRAWLSPSRRSHLLTRRKQARPCLRMIPAILVSCSVTPSVASSNNIPRSERPMAKCDRTTL